MNDQAIGFSDKFANAKTFAIAAAAFKVTTEVQRLEALAAVNTIRDWENQLDAEYESNHSVIEQRRLVKIKGELAALLEAGRKAAKAAAMRYEDEQEAIRSAEEAKRQAEAQNLAEDEALAAAELAQAAGDTAQAESIIEQPVIAPTIILPRATPKVPGHVRRTVKRFRTVNLAAIKPLYLMPDEVKIGGVVRSLGKAAEVVVGGIEVYEVVC